MRRSHEVRLTRVALLGATDEAPQPDDGTDAFLAFLDWIERTRVQLAAEWADEMTPRIRAGALTEQDVLGWNATVMAFQRAVLHAHDGLRRGEATANGRELPEADRFLRLVLRGPGDSQPIPIFAHGAGGTVQVAEALPVEPPGPAVVPAVDPITAAVVLAGLLLVVLGVRFWNQPDVIRAEAERLLVEENIARRRSGLPPLPVPDGDEDDAPWTRPIKTVLGWMIAGSVVLGGIWAVKTVIDWRGKPRLYARP